MQIPEENLRANVVITPHIAFVLSFLMWLVHAVEPDQSQGHGTRFVRVSSIKVDEYDCVNYD